MVKTEETQEKILEIYKAVKEICDKHDLRYYAIGGTAIGAARHSGFIPWDDDLDIAMPWKDYQKFFEIAPKELPWPYKVRISSQVDYSTSFFSKVHDISTTFIEPVEQSHPSAYKGIFVDIMPLHGIPETADEQKEFAKKIRWLFRTRHKQHRSMIDCKSIHSKLYWLAMAPINKVLPIDFWYKKWENLVTKYDFDNSRYTGYTWSMKLRTKTVFDRAWFDNYVELPFEDTTMRMPVGYHEMLTRQFGDYMQLPPEEERLNHGGGIVDTERPYAFYQEEFGKKGSLKEYIS